MQGIFFTSTALNCTTGINSASILCHLKIFESLVDHIDCLTMYKQSHKAKEYIKKHANVNVRDCITYISESLPDIQKKHRESKLQWSDIYDMLDVSPLKKYDHIYLLNCIFKPSSGYTYNSKKSGVFPYTSDSVLFDSDAIVIINLLSLLKANREFGIPIHELCYEPNALSYKYYHKDYQPVNYNRYYGYDKDDMYRIDSSQYYLNSLATNDFFEDDTKIYDLTFGLTNMKGSPTRKLFYDYMVNIPLEKKNIFVYDTIGDIGVENRTIDKHRYLDEIKKSRYTLIIPCHDQSCLSPYRFTESLVNDCLPIIHPACNVGDIEKSFGVDLSDLIDIQDFSENNRIRLLERYKQVFLSVNKTFK